MPNRESEVTAYLAADATLVAILTGGIYQSGNLPLEGLGESSTPDAFVSGVLLPTAIVRTRAPVPSGGIVDLSERVASASQILEVWLYADVADQEALFDARERVYALVQGHAFDAAYPSEWANELATMPEPGNLAPSGMVSRIDFLIRNIRKPT